MNNLYLFTSPFLVEKNTKNELEYLSDTVGISEYEREDEKTLRVLFLKFAAKHELIIKRDNDLINSIEPNVGSWRWAINWINMRSLTNKTQYFKLIGILKSDDEEPITAILNFHTLLRNSYRTEFLNTIVNRVMNSVSLIPYDVPNEELQNWGAIHLTTPWIWIVFLMQSFIHAETTTSV